MTLLSRYDPVRRPCSRRAGTISYGSDRLILRWFAEIRALF
jgi:hypothetical protein